MLSLIQNALRARRNTALIKAIWSGNEDFAVANLHHALFGPEDRTCVEWKEAVLRMDPQANRISRHLDAEKEIIGKIMLPKRNHHVAHEYVIKLNALEAAMFTGREDLAVALWERAGPERLQSNAYGESSALVILARGASMNLLDALALTISQKEWDFICHEDGTTARQELQNGGVSFLSVLKKRALSGSLPQTRIGAPAVPRL